MNSISLNLCLSHSRTLICCGWSLELIFFISDSDLLHRWSRRWSLIFFIIAQPICFKGELSLSISLSLSLSLSLDRGGTTEKELIFFIYDFFSSPIYSSQVISDFFHHHTTDFEHCTADLLHITGDISSLIFGGRTDLIFCRPKQIWFLLWTNRCDFNCALLDSVFILVY